MTDSIKLVFPFRVMSKSNEKAIGRGGRPYLSPKFKAFEKNIKEIARCYYKGKPVEGNIKMTITAKFRTGVRLDCFNIPKSIADALQGIVYKNDKQIVYGAILVEDKTGVDEFSVYIESEEEGNDIEFKHGCPMI